jgi:hypothetical protein
MPDQNLAGGQGDGALIPWLVASGWLHRELEATAAETDGPDPHVGVIARKRDDIPGIDVSGQHVVRRHTREFSQGRPAPPRQ